MYHNSQKLKLRSFKIRYGAIYEEIRLDLKCCGLHLPLQLLRKTVFAFCLTVLYEYTVFSLVLMSLLNLGMVFYIAACKPYNKQYMNNKALLEELLFIGCQIMIGMLLQEDMSVTAKFNIGWAIIACSGIIVVSNLLLLLKEQCKGLKKMYQLIKKMMPNKTSLISEKKKATRRTMLRFY